MNGLNDVAVAGLYCRLRDVQDVGYPLHPPCDRHACKQSEKACPALSLLCFQAHSAFVVSYILSDFECIR